MRWSARRYPSSVICCPSSEPMIRIDDRISIDDSEISESFIRSSGPGGQNVNKLATAVQLRFDVRHSPSLSHEVPARLQRHPGRPPAPDGGPGTPAQPPPPPG